MSRRKRATARRDRPLRPGRREPNGDRRTSVLDSAAEPKLLGARLDQHVLDRVAWVEQSSATALPQLILLNLSSSARQVVARPWPVGSCYPLGDARGAVCEERPSTDEFGGLREPWRKAIIEFANDFTFPGNPAGLRLNGMTYNKGERGGYYDPATDSRHLVDNDHSGQTPHLVGSSFTWVHDDPIRDPDQRFSGRTLYVMPLP